MYIAVAPKIWKKQPSCPVLYIFKKDSFIVLLCIDTLAECTKRSAGRAFLDLIRFLEMVYSFYFLLAFYFRILFLYTTGFNPTINKDVIIIINVIIFIIIMSYVFDLIMYFCFRTSQHRVITNDLRY